MIFRNPSYLYTTYVSVDLLLPLAIIIWIHCYVRYFFHTHIKHVHNLYCHISFIHRPHSEKLKSSNLSITSSCASVFQYFYAKKFWNNEYVCNNNIIVASIIIIPIDLWKAVRRRKSKSEENDDRPHCCNTTCKCLLSLRPG